MTKPKISVITASFNQGRYIKTTIESVLAQRYQPFEHIIVDGGSTDETISILKQYPHLKWSSEADEGQADALNKALNQATGDIIAWINSDDWYEEGTFDAVVAALEDYPVVMGSCAIVDDQGRLLYEVPNVERTWFDLLRYWVPYSIPTQPAIFFRREVLTGLERGGGELLDKELYYTMDYDLWARMAIRAPFLKRVDKRFAYYRMTETNKTGDAQGGLSFAEPEMARIFKRAETNSLAPSTAFSIIIPILHLSDELKRSIESIYLQSFKDFEIILVEQGASPAQRKELKDFIRNRNHEQGKSGIDSYIRTIHCKGQTLSEAIAAGVDVAEGRNIVAARVGTLFGSTFLADSHNTLSNNRVGMVLPWRYSHTAYQSLVPQGFAARGAAVDFEIAGLLDSPALPLLFVARRVALFECLDTLGAVPTQKAVRDLIALFLFKGWHVRAQAEIRATTPDAPVEEVNYLNNNRRQMVAELVVGIDERLSQDPFAETRAQHGCALVFEPNIVESCRAILKSN